MSKKKKLKKRYKKLKASVKREKAYNKLNGQERFIVDFFNGKHDDMFNHKNK